MNMKSLLVAAALSSVSGAAIAQEAGDITVGAGLSTFGLNFEAAYQINPQLRARGALMGGFSTDFEETEGGDNIKGEFNLGGAALLADYYPMQGGWRISGGLFISNTDLTATGTVDVSETDTADNREATLTAKLENEIAPMLTTGYDWAFADGWAFTSEVGVIFGGGINVTVEADNAADQADIDNDQELQDNIADAGDINALPYLSIGVSYRY